MGRNSYNFFVSFLENFRHQDFILKLPDPALDSSKSKVQKSVATRKYILNIDLILNQRVFSDSTKTSFMHCIHRAATFNDDHQAHQGLWKPCELNGTIFSNG